MGWNGSKLTGGWGKNAFGEGGGVIVPAFVQQKTAASGNTITLNAPTTGGSLLVLHSLTNLGISGVSGGGVTWVQVNSIAVTGGFVQTWYGLNATAGLSIISITLPRGGTTVAYNLSEYNGIMTAGALDDDTTNSGVSKNPAVSNLTLSAQCLVAVCAGSVAGSYEGGPTENFTRLDPVSSALGLLESAYKFGDITGTGPGWDLSADVSWGTVGAGLKEI